MILQNKFPKHYVRENCLAEKYCEIAMESFFEASANYSIIKEDNYTIFKSKEYLIMENKAIISIVFSAMCIESFLNDFAAASLGDSEFYENFDRLSPIGKFQLVSKFILHVDVDKSKAYYYYLKRLFRLRDAYVHNKSKKSEFRWYTKEEIEEIHKIEKEAEDVLDFDQYTLPIDNIENLIKDALEGLKAIYHLALFFDKNDVNVNAVIRLFHPFSLLYVEGTQKECKEFVFRKIKLKAEDYYEV